MGNHFKKVKAMKQMNSKKSRSGFKWVWTENELDFFRKKYPQPYKIGHQGSYFNVQYCVTDISPILSYGGPIGGLIDPQKEPNFSDFEWKGWLYYVSPKVPTGWWDDTVEPRQPEMTNSLYQSQLEEDGTSYKNAFENFELDVPSL